MAYFDEKMKKEMELQINPILKEYGVKAILKVLHDNAVVIYFKSGRLDLNHDKYGIPTSREISLYDVSKKYDGECKEFLTKILDVLDSKNYDVCDDEGNVIDVGYFVYGSLGYHQFYIWRT